MNDFPLGQWWIDTLWPMAGKMSHWTLRLSGNGRTTFHGLFKHDVSHSSPLLQCEAPKIAKLVCNSNNYG